MNINFEKNNSVFILRLNIASLQKHFDELLEMLSLILHKLDILYITETRIPGVLLTNILIPGCKIFHRVSSTITGGVGVYITHGLKHEIIDGYN